MDFVIAYPHAPIEMAIYMELPQGIQTKHGNSKEHVLKLEKNVYGWARVEFIPRRQTHVHRIHNVAIR